MADLSGFIAAIQGLTTLLTGSGQTTQRRGVLKVAGVSVFDDGTQTVLGGVQVITGSGTWDGHSSKVMVKGSGARTIAIPNPDGALAHEGLEVLFTDHAGNAAGNVITLDPVSAGTINGSGTVAINANNGFRRLLWRATDNWQDVS